MLDLIDDTKGESAFRVVTSTTCAHRSSTSPPSTIRLVAAHLMGMALILSPQSARGQYDEIAGTPSFNMSLVFPITEMNLPRKRTSHDMATAFSQRRLRKLAIFDRTLTDSDLDGLKQCKFLKSINLNNTAVTGIFLRDLDNMADLAELSLNNNAALADDNLQFLKNCPDLRKLDLSKTRITDRGVEHLLKLDFLEELNLAETGVSIRGVHLLRELATLRKLVLPIYEPDMSDAIAKEIAALPNLESFYGNDEFSDIGLKSIGTLRNLRHVHLRGARFTRAGLLELKQLDQLELLSFFKAALTDDGLAVVKEIPSLRRLVIFGCDDVTDKGIEELQTMTALRHLEIDSSHVGSAGILSLKHLINLRCLNISAKNVGDEAIEAIVNMRQLEELNVDGTKVSAEGVRRLSVLRRLKKLYAEPLNDNPDDFDEFYKTLPHLDNSIPF